MKPSLLRKIETLAERRADVAGELSSPEVLGDSDKFRRLSQEYAALGPVVDAYDAYRAALDEIEGLELLKADSDPEMRAMAEADLPALNLKRDALQLELEAFLVPKDPLDNSNVFLEIRAGTGGDEAAIFAGDLFRMYQKYAEAQGWALEVLSENEGEHGGFKEIISRIAGFGAYSRLKFESGAHRVQRVPETEAQGRIHTSAATVAVLAEVEEAQAIDINPADLKVDTYRSSGAGGQHVNKTESAIRITHVPTGIVVACQTQRSQHKNRDAAMKMLRSRMYEQELQKRNVAKQKIEDSKSDIEWGHQIRSYVLDQSRIKDLRTGVEIADTQKVLDGYLDPYIEASLKSGL